VEAIFPILSLTWFDGAATACLSSHLMSHKDPDLQPGSVTFDLSLGPVFLRIVDLPTAWEPFVSTHYEPFAEPAGSRTADLTVTCREGSGVVIPLPGPGKTPIMEVLQEGRDQYSIRSHWQHGTVDLAAGSASLTLTHRGATEFRMSLENFLRIAGQLLLMRRKAFLLHSAGVLDEQRCFLFFGHSGAGKSTATALSAPRRALSDDMVLIDLQGSRVQAHAVPFYGLFPPEERVRGAFPVAGGFRLRQATGDRLERLKIARATATISASVPFIHDMGLPPDLLTDLALEFCRRVPVYDLQFTRTNRFWDLLAELPDPTPL